MNTLQQSADTFYEEYIISPEWKYRRIRALWLAGWRCESCGDDFEPGLHVHHLTYRNMGNELDNDLQVLCRVCHRAADEEREIDPVGHRQGVVRDKFWKQKRRRNRWEP